MTNLQWLFVHGMLSAIYLMCMAHDWAKTTGTIIGIAVQGFYIWETQKELKKSKQSNNESNERSEK